MDGKDFEKNPFAALFESTDQAKKFSSEFRSEKDGTSSTALDIRIEKEDEDVQILAKRKLEKSALIESIFLITLDNEILGPNRPSCCFYLRDFANTLDGQTWLDNEIVGQAVFERLLSENPSSDVICSQDDLKPTNNMLLLAVEPLILKYLYQCYCRCRQKNKCDREIMDKCKEIILLNARTCLQQPELYSSQNVHQQLIDICLENFHALTGAGSSVIEFFDSVVSEINFNMEDGSLQQMMTQVFAQIPRLMKGLNLMSGEISRYIDLMGLLTRQPITAQTFLKYNEPIDKSSGRAYEVTLLGSLLSYSSIPQHEAGPYDFFNNPSTGTKQEHDITESNIWQPLTHIPEKVFQLLFNLVKLSPDLRHSVLSWIGQCIHANSGRSKLWSSQVPELFNKMYCSEGFSLNLCMVMLKFSEKFSEPNSPKLLKIQTEYTKAIPADEEDAKKRSIHAIGLNAETCLAPLENTDKIYEDTNYNFITECFFLTHQCIRMGFHTVHDKFLKLNQDLHRIQRLYQEVRAQGASDDIEPVRSTKMQMEKGMALYLNMKAALTVPSLLEKSFKFHISTATWLCEAVLFEDSESFHEIRLPLPTSVPERIGFIPENLIGNITDFTIFLHRFKDEMYQAAGTDLQYLMTVIIVFMGSAERMKNPHLRAELAETLSALLPNSQSTMSQGLLSSYHKEQLFTQHPLVDYIAETLINVFVSIEMTGQSVAFEQKFNYRRPMYQVLEYIWENDRHKAAIQKLVVVAEENIDAVDAPLFLRFINLLINDAIFLLDEALSYMSQIKEKQQEKDRGDWNQLNSQQQQENNNNFRQITMLARYHNVMANSTIHCLEYLSKEIKSIFCHSTMVDRIAGMLNYFLLHLVGPKQKNFNVKDKNEYEFNPQQIVSEITAIFLHLGESDSFCLAVCSDGRSYSSDLFPKTIQVLQRTGQHPQVISEFILLEERIKRIGKKYEEDEEMLADAPEEFLDPIMGTLMKDPVMLPTSGTIIDKPVIARHILSDQTDPFNRKPLTMNMVVPEEKLKEKITKWIKSQTKDT